MKKIWYRRLVDRLSWCYQTYVLRQNGRELAWLTLRKLNRNLHPLSKDRGRDPKVVFFELRRNHNHMAFAYALAHRLHRLCVPVEFIECGAGLPICITGNSHMDEREQRPCTSCRRMFNDYLDSSFPRTVFDVDQSHLDTLKNDLSGLSNDELATYVYEGVPVGSLCRNSEIYYLRTEQYRENDRQVREQLIIASCLVVNWLASYLRQGSIRCLVMQNGDLFIERIAGHMCETHGIRFVTHDYTIDHSMRFGVNESVWTSMVNGRAYREYPLQLSERKQAQAYIHHSKKIGSYQAERFFNPHDRAQSLLQRFHIDRKYIAAYPNMTFETSVAGRERTFDSQIDWLLELIEYYRKRDDLLVVVRCHPAEYRTSGAFVPRETVEEMIMAQPDLPKNARIISASEALNTYELVEHATANLVYASTVGLDCAMRNRKPVTAAHSYYSEHGFTYDPKNKQEFFQLLDQLIAGKSDALTPEENDALLLYVYWYFFEQLFPIDFIHQTPNDAPIVFPRKLRKAMHGRNRSLEALCRTIVEGGELSLKESC